MPDPTLPELLAWGREHEYGHRTIGFNGEADHYLALAAILESMQWRPIAEAPTESGDAFACIGWFPSLAVSLPMWWSPGLGRWCGPCGKDKPSHFRPNDTPPPPPEADR